MLILLMLTTYINNSEFDERELKKQIAKKADKTEVIEFREDVDRLFRNHIMQDQQAYNSLKELMEAYLSGQEELIQSIDKRLERIENKQ